MLIVEDDNDDFGMLQDALQDECVVSRVSDFDPFKVRERLGRIDVVLVDLYEDMTGQSRGLDVITAISQGRSARSIAVIVMSSEGRAQLADIARAMEDGRADDFIWKHGSRAATATELKLKVKNACQRVRNEVGGRRRRLILLRAYAACILFLSLGTVVGALQGWQTATLSLETLLVLVTVLPALPWTNRYL